MDYVSEEILNGLIDIAEYLDKVIYYAQSYATGVALVLVVILVLSCAILFKVSDMQNDIETVYELLEKIEKRGVNE